jgi:hypothetical protein
MRALRIAGWAALAVALVAAGGALLPISPQFIHPQLDASFAATLHFGAATGQAVGTRLISTFGPLGFLFYGIYFPGTYAWLLALRASLAAVTCWALAWLGFTAWGSPWGAAVVLFACAPFLASPDVWFLTLPLLAVLIELPEGHPAPAALRVALGGALGLVSLIKFTFLLAALAVLVPMTVAVLIARRRVPVLMLAALSATVLACLATGHTWADGFSYLAWSFRDISGTYSSAMQLPTDASLYLHAAAVSVLVFVAAGLLLWRRLQVGRWAGLIGVAGGLLLLFKAGFVRADVHVFITTFGLLVAAMLLAILSSRRPAQVAAAALLVELLPGWLWWHAVAVHGPASSYFAPVFSPVALRRLGTGFTQLKNNELPQSHAARAAAIRTRWPLPPLHGPIDAYSWDQWLLLAHDLDFRPRPVFHSYMAYSPRLVHANADFLLGTRAPEWILFRVAPIDNRLPALDDAASWPLIVARYRLVEGVGPFALLQRRPTPLPWTLERIGGVQTLTGTVVPVPSAAGGPIWARVDVRNTPRDALVTALIAAPVVSASLVRNDGAVRSYRLVPALARDGFVLAPLVETTEDFMRFVSRQSGGTPAHDVAALIVEMRAALGIAPGPRLVEVEFFRLVVDDSRIPAGLGRPEAPSIHLER